MAAPIKTCEFCEKTINDRSYRSLTSKISAEQYGNTFVKLGIDPVGGYLCNNCVNKLNRIKKLDTDILTKVIVLTQERDKLLEMIKQLPGILSKCQKTPRRGEKRSLVKQTPTPKSKLKKSLFQTPNRPRPSPKCIIHVAETEVPKKNKSTQTKQPREDFDVKITVKYANNDERSKCIRTEPEKTAVKAMFTNRQPTTIMKHFRKNEKYKDAMLDVVKKEIMREISILVKKNGDFFQNHTSENLLNFDWTAVSYQFQAKAPFLYSVFCAAADMNLRSKNKLPCLITSAAILLYTRSQGLNQLQYIIGLIADKCGLTKEGLKILHDLGVAVSPSSVHKKKKQLVKQQEKMIVETVTKYVKHREKIISNAEEPFYMGGLRYNTENSTFVAADVDGENSNCIVVECDGEDMQYHADVESKAGKGTTHLGGAESEAGGEILVSTVCSEEIDRSVVGNLHCDSMQTGSNAKPIEILGDNLDVTINPAKMTIEKQRKSLHWFLIMAKQKCVTAIDDLNLPSSDVSTEKRDILCVPTSSWLPSVEQTDSLYENIIFHVSKILLRYIKFLKPAIASFPPYIQHPYLEKTKEKSVFHNCNLIDASENSSQGMITILKNIHNLAVPHLGGEIQQRIVFGGDVLTNERAFSAQEAMQNSPSKFESLRGLVHRPEGLHREMNFLLGIYQLFYKESSSSEIGTLYQLRNVLNRRDVSGPDEVINKFRPHHQFIEDVTDGYVVGAFMDIMNMDDLSSTPQHAPIFSLMSDQEKNDWIFCAARKVIETLGFCNFESINKLREKLQALDHDDDQMEAMKNKNEDMYNCALCDKKYMKLGWFKKHLEKKHSWKFFGVENNEHAEADFNPIHSFLLMSLLLRDTCNAYQLGDGDRIVRNAYMEWLYASAVKHSKYKLWLWRMISYIIAILDARDSFEYKWNMTVNLKGGIQNNIPNDNCVELQVHNIKKQLNTQGANKSFESAKLICMTTQVIDGIKEQLMTTTKTIKSKRTRPTVDKTKDIATIVKVLRQKGQVSDLKWTSFSNFKDPFHCVSSVELHDWINDQKRIASFFM